jgi:hypothetical protein
MEQIKNYLEKVYTEYVDYENFLKSIIKPLDVVRKEVAEKITAETTEEEVMEIYFNDVEKSLLHRRDFVNQQQRLFFTVEAYKDVIEIPQEVLEKVKGMNFIQIFGVKNNTTEVINQEALEFTKTQIRQELNQGVDIFKKKYL